MTSITLLAGTTKGLFLLTSDEDRLDWRVEGPLCDGWTINHAIGDIETGTLWAAGGGEWHGAGVWRSENGADWRLSKLADGEVDEWIRNDPDTADFFGKEPAPPAPYSGVAESIWSLGRHNGRLYAGAKPAALFASDDGGENWEEVENLRNHPSADTWNPGAAGLTLHTIVPSPTEQQSLWLGISAAGVFATEDGGQSWERRNRMSNAEGCAGHVHPAAPSNGETGHCVHNMVRAAGAADLLYQQNHHGVWRSRDGGRSWDDINAGLPSTFGFPIAVHPSQPETIWVLPLNGDSAGRYPPEASAAVWRSRNGGENWEACRSGLPQENCYFTVLRQAMTVDTTGAPGLYFGTNSGSIFASLDEGDTWSEIARHLPTVLSIETMTRD